MIGAGLMLLCVAASAFLLMETWRAWAWHHRGVGERQALVEYARIRREQPDTAEARLPEAEFVRYHVASRPGATPFLVAALLLLLIGLPASCALLAGWSWN
ncbi:MAG TPA: hypothetical protein VFW60_04820 [Rhodanobacteraceae bacterium]|nr:hypothetical protein [Rhodanobacteraceae bacterium]